MSAALDMLRPLFAPHIVQRGDRDFAEGRVTLRSRSATELMAHIDGSSPCLVSLALHAEAVLLGCSCPYAVGGNRCEHVWAAIHAAEADGWFDRLRFDERVAGGLVEDDGQRHAIYGGEYDNDGEYNDEDYGDDVPRTRHSLRLVPSSTRERPDTSGWRRLKRVLDRDSEARERLVGDAAAGEFVYIIESPDLAGDAGQEVSLARRKRAASGGWGPPRPAPMALRDVPHLPDPADRRLIAWLANLAEPPWPRSPMPAVPSLVGVPAATFEQMLPALCATGRCRLRLDPEDPDPPVMRWDDAAPWAFVVALALDEKAKAYSAAGFLVREGERRVLDGLGVMLRFGTLAFVDGVASRVERGGGSLAAALVKALEKDPPIALTETKARDLVLALMECPERPLLALPPPLRPEEIRHAPQPGLFVHDPGPSKRLAAEVVFAYGTTDIASDDTRAGIALADMKFIARDRAAEAAALEALLAAGWVARPLIEPRGKPTPYWIAASKFAASVPKLLAAGWSVKAEGKLFRASRSFGVSVKSGIDWFEVRGGAQFDELRVGLPEILAAIAREQRYIALGDGSLGLLPEAWLERLRTLAELGAAHEDALRFTPAQVALLDAALAEAPDVDMDAMFRERRERLRGFTGVQPAEPPASFTGALRPYQREGLGWLRMLRDLGFGGCLADDMGLGKTVQVLALLAEEHARRARGAAPSLVVAPRSLVHNWMAEARRFAPRLRVVDHTGAGRDRAAAYDGADLVVTTYGTLRRDIARLREVPFRWAILDEAQVIKNARSESAQAARQLRAEHRLALSGTPIENHLGELWSLFEFLNPGMLGASAAFRRFARRKQGLDPAEAALLARALRPFVLRRTKGEVAADLPPRTDQTILLELERPQRALYDELRAHYRAVLMAAVADKGVGRVGMEILEALLRLRQAACHPALLDKRRAKEGSAKLDALFSQLEEVRAEGHKALVFSQFTGLLDLVRTRLTADGVPFAYLDGSTSAKQRTAEVARFQDDPACPLFLISLKAGGLGLNLTAAEYVFLLDPWWNPAVEAQAIDRAHRIGQTRPVMAYRLVAADTVEERILELQERKRALATAILDPGGATLRDLTAEDLERLLS